MDARLSGFIDRLAHQDEADAERELRSYSKRGRQTIKYDWPARARKEQLPPGGDWQKWLYLGGRGAGKTRAGAEWIRDQVDNGARRIALVAPTAADARDIMVLGESGILAISPPGNRPTPVLSRRRLEWPNGAAAMLYSADEPERLRGHQHDAAWCDEVCLTTGTRIRMAAGSKPIEHVVVGDFVQTRQGLRRVVRAECTNLRAELWKLETFDGRSLIGTPNHPVWVEGRGFVPLRTVAHGDMLLGWHPRLLFGVASVGTSTKITTATEGDNCYIAKFTRRRLVRYLMDIRSIIATRIRVIGRQAISSLCLFPTTCLNMSLAGLPHGASTREALGFVRVGLRSSQHYANVQSAARLSSQLGNRQSSVPTDAGRKIFAGDTHCIASDIRVRDIRVKSVSCLGRRGAVFNIEVDGDHEYFANDVLVHNCAWRYARDAWDMLMLGLRLGSDPRVVVTTTPKPIDILVGTGENGRMLGLLNDSGCVVTRGSSYLNEANLSPTFFTHITRQYLGTRLGRQELDAEIIDDLGGLWSRKTIEGCRVRSTDDLRRIVVSIDPAVTSGEESDETGIVVAGRDASGHGYVLDDLSGRYAPLEWARRAIDAYHRYEADRIVAEVNNGGDMVEATIRTVDPDVSFRSVHASRGKVVRAEPVAALYEQGRVHHAGAFPALEDQMCAFTSDFSRDAAGYSPDRVDALVWAITELMVEAVPYQGLIDFYRERAQEAQASETGLR